MRNRVSCWFVALVALVLLAGCSDDSTEPPPSPTGRWRCPANWVETAHGGCGPAVLLCVADGGAAPHACDGVDLSRPPLIALPDGGTVRGFYRLPDGGIGGAWPEPGDPDGPPDENWVPEGVPAEDWAPDAGIASCAPGWQRLPDGTCDPRLRTDCPAGSEALPGGLCTPTALVDCPAGEYTDPGVEAVGARVVHVHAGADASAADGSVALPYATISAGITAAGSGGWTLVAAGEYRERVVVREGWVAHVLGVCAARVTLRGAGPTGPNGATIAVTGVATTLDLRGVTVTGEGRGLQASGAASARAGESIFRDNMGEGIIAYDVGTSVDLSSSIIRDTRVTSQLGSGRGLIAQGGAMLRVRRVHLRGNTTAGLLVSGASSKADIANSAVRDTRGVPGVNTAAVQVQNGALLRATSTVIAENLNTGAVALSAGTVLEIALCVVRNSSTFGVSALEGATLRVTDTLIEGNRGAAFTAQGMGSDAVIASSVVRRNRGHGLQSLSATLRATNVIVSENRVGANSDEGSRIILEESILRDMQARDDGTGGIGLQARQGSTLEATRVLVANARDTGALASGKGTRLSLRTSVVRNTQPLPSGHQGHGVDAKEGAHVDLENVHVAHNVEDGVLAQDTGTRVEVHASVLRRTLPYGSEGGGHGAGARAGATLHAEGALIAENHDSGVIASGGGTLVELFDSVVRDTRARPDAIGFVGYGIWATRGARLQVARTLASGNSGIGIVIVDPDTFGNVFRSIVRGTRESRSGVGGEGVAVGLGARLTASGLVVEDNREVGILAWEEETFAEFNDCVVRRSLPLKFGTFGRGLELENATVRGERFLVTGTAEVGVYASGGSAHLTDLLVMGVAVSRRGLGVGMYGVGGTVVVGERVALQDVQGAALASTSVVGTTGTAVTLRDVFVRDVGHSTVRFSEDGHTIVPELPLVSYGLHVGNASALDVSRATLLGGGHGFFNAGGTLRVRQGLFANYSRAGATTATTPASATTLVDVALRGTDGTVARNSGLPSATFPRPTDPPPTN